ncbi:universal stress protein [Cytophagaceae bacterium ABcell3]|nr:universal stress protein [Cytophagaceae bacterium ABcell3]
MKLSKILVPTDFSKNSINALEYAVKLAEKHKAEIMLYHVYQAVLVNTDPKRNKVSFDIQEDEKVAKNKLQKLVTHIQSKCDAIKYTYKVGTGQAIEAVKKVVKDDDIDMVIAGTRGAGAVNSVLFGSFTAELIESAPCPVLAIPEHARLTGFSSAIFATEFKAKDITSITILSNLLAPFDSHIRVIHVAEKPEKSMEKMMQFEKDVRERANKKVKFTFEIVRKEHFLDGLLDQMTNLPTDLLAMSTRKRTFIEKLYDRSITKVVAYQSEVPLLASHVD